MLVQTLGKVKYRPSERSSKTVATSVNKLGKTLMSRIALSIVVRALESENARKRRLLWW
jgi:hypothetical protein